MKTPARFVLHQSKNKVTCFLVFNYPITIKLELACNNSFFIVNFSYTNKTLIVFLFGSIDNTIKNQSRIVLNKRNYLKCLFFLILIAL